jgi:hypothetical protein
MYLRCLAGDYPRSWLQWLPWAEFSFNTSYQSALRAMPLEVLYGRPPLALVSYTPGAARVAAIDQQLRDRDVFLAKIWECLIFAQDTMRENLNKKRRHVEFSFGEWVLLCLHQRMDVASWLLPPPSLGRATLALIRLSRNLVLSLTTYSYRPRHAYMVCSTSPCSRSMKVPHLLPSCHCRPSCLEGWFLLCHRWSRLTSIEAVGSSWCIGMVVPPLMPLGSRSPTSRSVEASAFNQKTRYILYVSPGSQISYMATNKG